MATTRSHKKVRKILNRDDSIYIIKTPAGLHHVLRAAFNVLLDYYPSLLVKVGPRVATVREGYEVTISDGSYTFYRPGHADKWPITLSSKWFGQVAPPGTLRIGSRVYLIGHPLLAHVKIGFANDPHQRLKDLQTGSSVKLDLLGYIDGDSALEHGIHGRLEPWRLAGEWFALSSENMGIIREIFGIDLHEYLRASCRAEINGAAPIL